MNRPSAAIVLPSLGLVSSLVVVLEIGAARLGVDPTFQLGLSLSLILTFGLIWTLGARYPDVGWLVVIAALLAVKSALRPEALPLGEGSALVGALALATMLGFAAFLLSFFRVPIKSGRLELAFGFAVVAYGVLLWFAPQEFVRDFDLEQAVPRYVGAVLLGYAAVHGLLTLRPLPPKRRRYVAAVTVATIGATACYLVSARWIADGRALTTPLLDHAFAMTLGVFLLADLIVFHRSYVKDKASRIAKRDGDVTLETRRELARGLRTLVNSPTRIGQYGDFRFEWHVVGDETTWHDVWRMQGEMRLLFGDIDAPSGLAPLVALTLRSLLVEAKSRVLSLEGAARYLNGRLLDLFGRRAKVTFYAVSLGEDGSVEVFNAGGLGFFLASRDGGKHLALNSTPLGIAADLELSHEPLPLEDHDVLFAAGNVLMQDATGIRRILNFFDDAMDFALSLEHVQAQVLKLLPGGAVDGQMLLVIERVNSAAGAASQQSAG